MVVLAFGQVELDWSLIGGCGVEGLVVVLEEIHRLKVVCSDLIRGWLPGRWNIKFGDESYGGDDVVPKKCLKTDGSAEALEGVCAV